MADELRNIKDDASNDYLLSRQVAHEFNSPGTTAFINSFSRQMQEPPKGQMAEQRFRATQKPLTRGGKKVAGTGMSQEELAVETGAQVEADPFTDPLVAAEAVATGGTYLSIKQGMKLMPSLARAISKGIIAAGVDIPLGMATEEVAEDYPALALPFNVLVGMVPANILEDAIYKGVVKGLGKAADSDTIRRVVSDMKLRLADETGAVGKIGGKADIPTVSPKMAEGGVTIYRAADDDFVVQGISFAESYDTAKVYTENPNFGGGIIYQTTIPKTHKIFDLSGGDTWNKISKIIGREIRPEHGGGEISQALQFNPGILDDIESAGYDWVKYQDDFPKGSITYTAISDKASDIELKEIEHIRAPNRKRIGAVEKIQEKELDTKTKKIIQSKAYQDRFTELLDEKGDLKEARRLTNKEFGISNLKPSESPSPSRRAGELGAEGQSILKSVINSLNDTVNNEIGAVGDIENIKKSLAKTGLKGKELETKAQEIVSASLEGPPPTTKYVGNINAERLDTTDKIKNLLELNTEQFKAQFFEARRGVRTWEEAAKEAEKYTLEDLLGRKPGQAYNDAQSLNARIMQVTSAENLQGMREKIKTGSASDREKAEFMQAVMLHYSIMEQVAGITAEAGRTLNIFKKLAGGGDIKELRKLMQNLPATPEEIADALSTIDTTAGVNRLVEGTMRATSKDMWLEFWINGLLWLPTTHAANIAGNTLFGSMQIPERYLASVWSKIFRDNAIESKEALHMAYGLTEGFKDGLRAALKVMRTGQPSDIVSKIETERIKAITSGNVRDLPLIKKMAPNALQEGGMGARAVDFLGETIRTPGRFLGAEDEFFKTIGYRMELRAQASRLASQEGLKGNEFESRVAEILSNPEKNAPNIHLAAIDAARYMTFTKSLESKLGRALSSTTPVGNPAGDIAIKTIAPFIRTPSGIFKATAERTPLALVSKRFWDDVGAGGARRDLALAKASMGSMIMMMGGILAANGVVTGAGPSDPALRANMTRQGWEPFSFHVNNKYYGFGRLEPLGTVFGLAAEFTEVAGLAGPELQPEVDKIASSIVKSISKNITSKTWLRGISDAVEALNDPDRYGDRWWQNYVASFIPSISRGIEQAIDPEFSAIYDEIDALKSKIPFLSRSLQPSRDLWGEVNTKQIGQGERSWLEVVYTLSSPIHVSDGKPSAIDKELTRMKIGLSKPQRKQAFLGVPMELTPELYDEFIQFGTKKVLNGKDLKEFLNDFVKSPDYKQMSDERKEEEIRDVMTKARNIAKKKMLEKYPQLIDMATSWKQRLAQ